MVTPNPYDPYTTRPVSGGSSKDVKFFEPGPSREGSRRAKAIAARNPIGPRKALK